MAMDCAKLQADIDKLSALKARLEEQLDALSKDESSFSETKQSITELQIAEDEILEQYASEIIRRNPDCYSWDWQTMGEIPNGTIKSIAALPDGRFVVGNNSSEVFIGSYAEDGSIVFSEAIQTGSVVDAIVTAPNGDLFIGGSYSPVRRLSGIDSSEPSLEEIGTLDDIARDGIVLPNGDLFMYGVDGAAAIIPRQDDGSFGQCQEFEAPRYPTGRRIPDNASATATPEGNVIMGTKERGLQIFRKQISGHYTLGETFESFAGYSLKASAFPNGDLLLAVETGEIFIKQKRENGSFGPRELILGNIGKLDPNDPGYITNLNMDSLTPLPDGSILICYSYEYWEDSFAQEPLPICEIRKCARKPDGEYEISEPIIGSGNIFSKLTVMPDGRFLTYSRQSSRIVEINQPKTDLDSLKAGLADVAKKHS